MAIKVQTRFIRKGTVRIICYVYNDAEELVDVTSVKISIVDSGGTVVADEQTMDTSVTGTYEYYYTTSITVEEGNYQIECDILDSTYHTFAHGHFEMVKGINEA